MEDEREGLQKIVKVYLFIYNYDGFLSIRDITIKYY